VPLMTRYSEPYGATGGLAAEGVLNQLGRPDIEPLEVLVREAVQNCWDARRGTSQSITVEVGRTSLDGERLAFLRDELLVNPPPGLPLSDELSDAVDLLYFADFGTDGLGGPTRADQSGRNRDFVDFVRNIGQPPDKELGGGSFGYGKAAFYIASKAHTIIIDTLGVDPDGKLERRFIACALGGSFDLDGRPFTGRHWWGRMVGDIPEPLVGEEAAAAAAALGLPARQSGTEQGTTIVVLAPSVAVETEDGVDETMLFVAEALVWNFWPRMIDTAGAGRRTIEFRVIDNGRPIRPANPRTDQRLRDFVEAMDRMREAPGGDDDLLLDRPVAALRPARQLGRLVIKKGPVSALEVSTRAIPVGARLTADAVHHVALMRNAELIVRYLPGPIPPVARMGYSGVFKCGVDVDDAFRDAEPPTHDNWVYRAVSSSHGRRFVKIALERIASVCREAAGYDASIRAASDGAAVPLGEFADTLASLLPGVAGPGARRQSGSRSPSPGRRAPGRQALVVAVTDEWSDGLGVEPTSATAHDGSVGRSENPRVQGGGSQTRRPQLRSVGEPEPTISSDGVPVIRYPFELRAYGSHVRLSAVVEVMSSDGGQVESDAPLGTPVPTVRAWVDPTGVEYPVAELDARGDVIDGRWALDVALSDEAMMRVDVSADAI
jgi:hypothetical protein